VAVLVLADIGQTWLEKIRVAALRLRLLCFYLLVPTRLRLVAGALVTPTGAIVFLLRLFRLGVATEEPLLASAVAVVVAVQKTTLAPLGLVLQVKDLMVETLQPGNRAVVAVLGQKETLRVRASGGMVLLPQLLVLPFCVVVVAAVKVRLAEPVAAVTAQTGALASRVR
jgi:hypothetical protein